MTGNHCNPVQLSTRMTTSKHLMRPIQLVHLSKLGTSSWCNGDINNACVLHRNLLQKGLVQKMWKSQFWTSFIFNPVHPSKRLVLRILRDLVHPFNFFTSENLRITRFLTTPQKATQLVLFSKVGTSCFGPLTSNFVTRTITTECTPQRG